MKAITVFVNLFIVANGWAQCSAFAGNDTILCAGTYPQLRGASVTGGVPPYYYSWESSFLPANFRSVFDDSTKLHPTIVFSIAHGREQFNFKVTDAVGNVCSDSIEVFYSYPVTVVSSDTDRIISGDSVGLNVNAGGGFQPFMYYWEPMESLFDHQSKSPVAFPSITTLYYVNVRDSVGCVRRDSILIMVSPTTNLSSLWETNVLYPNPFGKELFITHASNNQEVLFFNIHGENVTSATSSSCESMIQTDDLPPGIYFIQLWRENKLVGMQRVMKINR